MEVEKGATKAFETTKSQLTTDHILVHYDSSKPIIMACDASPYSLGAVISHKLPNGEKKPITFALHSLASANSNTHNWRKKPLPLYLG